MLYFPDTAFARPRELSTDGASSEQQLPVLRFLTHTTPFRFPSSSPLRIGWKRATTVIVILNFVMFLITLIVGGAKCDGAFVKGNEMAGPSAATLAFMGGKCEPAIRDGEFWLLFTPMILHSGILHLASNSFFQVCVAQPRGKRILTRCISRSDVTWMTRLRMRLSF